MWFLWMKAINEKWKVQMLSAAPFHSSHSLPSASLLLRMLQMGLGFGWWLHGLQTMFTVLCWRFGGHISNYDPRRVIKWRRDGGPINFNFVHFDRPLWIFFLLFIICCCLVHISLCGRFWHAMKELLLLGELNNTHSVCLELVLDNLVVVKKWPKRSN